uniref:Embryogenesis transmembrane protein-like n=1 Tax=Oryza barthii TaxID=65489 RepID=A0A0D3GFL0_9ORYZ
MANQQSLEEPKDEGRPLEYCLRKYLLLLAIMVATVTYAAGFNPPGGVWQNTEAGHLAGDSIIRDTYYPRYLVFFYCNAAAFALSIVVIILIFILAVVHDKRGLWISMIPLRVAMVLDLLGLMMAYAAGTSRGVLKARNACVLVAIFVYMAVQVVLTLFPEKPELPRCTDDGKKEAKERRRKLLLLLATFVMSITYQAGLSAPGGYWDNSKEGHTAGDPVMREHHSIRLKAFFAFNAIAFVMSLLIIMLLLDKQLVIPLLKGKNQNKTSPVRTFVLKAYIFIALVGLAGAYAIGSSRESDTTIYVGSLVFAVLACIIVLKAIISCQTDSNERSNNVEAQTSTGNGGEETKTSNVGAQKNTRNAEFMDQAQSLVVLLSTLVATVTYQAGLVPPGGVWQDNWIGHEAGDSILLSMQPERYRVFFYCNSIAFAASLVIIILVQYKPILKLRVLQFAMILDLFGLIGAYSAGSCRDVTTSIYVIALAGAVLIYVVIHVLFITLEDEEMGKEGREKDQKLEDKRRKRLLLFAVLCVTLTYQAGLTPPGGFRLMDDEFGHHAGDPVLFYNYPRRYNAFFYCNSMSFMSSIALIILLVNPKLYRPAIRSYALSVCTAVGMFVLVCAYAAGSTQHLKTSIYIFGLVVLVFFVMIVLVIYSYWRKSSATQNEDITKQDTKTVKPTGTKSDVGMEDNITADVGIEDNITAKSTELGKSSEIEDKCEDKQNRSNNSIERAKQETAIESPKKEDKSKKKHATRKYLMLLGVLAASVTYQAGLNPPGGVWQGNSNGHAAGNPVMHDNKRYRYLIFFYSNSTSFVASIVVIILLLPEKLLGEAWSLHVMNITIVLDLLGLLLAYMAGSRMRLQSSGYFVVFVIDAAWGSTGSAFLYPQLTATNYTSWAIRVQEMMEDQGVWEADKPAGANVDARKDKKARSHLLQALPEDFLNTHAAKKTTVHQVWQCLKTRYVGVDWVKAARL